MPKSRVRKKNGKKVKPAPRPKGLSKTKMKKIMEMISQQKQALEAGNQLQETRTEGAPLEISGNMTKKLNVAPTGEINLQGPELSNPDAQLD